MTYREEWLAYNRLLDQGWKRGRFLIGELLAWGYTKEQANRAFEKLKANPENVRSFKVSSNSKADVKLYNFNAFVNVIEQARNRGTTLRDEDVDASIG